tara:strand:- start:38 stop:328 length:291 start_codon:yes stop_codon:yes gene_type:complete
MVTVQLVIDLKDLGDVLVNQQSFASSPARGDTLVMQPSRPALSISPDELMVWKVSHRRMEGGVDTMQVYVNYHNEVAKAWQREQIAARQEAQEESA